MTEIGQKMTFNAWVSPGSRDFQVAIKKLILIFRKPELARPGSYPLFRESELATP